MSKSFEQIKEMFIEPVRKKSFAPWAMFMFISVLPFFCMIAYLVTSSITETQEEDIDSRFNDQMDIIASHKAQTIDAWIEDRSLLARRITHSRTIQMFTTDINQSELNEGFTDELKVRKLYIEELLTTFVSQNEVENAYLVNRRSKVFAQDSLDQELPMNYSNYARDVLMKHQQLYSPLRMNGSKMLMDIYIPIFSLKKKNNTNDTAQENSVEKSNQIAGVFVITVSIKDKLIQFMELKNQPFKGQNIYLFQEVSGGVEMVRLQSEYEGIFSQDKDALLKTVFKEPWSVYSLDAPGKYDLSKIPRFGSNSQDIPRHGEILVVKKQLQNVPLTIMIYLNLHAAYQDLLLQRKQMHVIGQLFALLVFVFVLALWWKIQDARHILIAKQYESFSKKINAQRHLLLSINSNVNEHISLKYFDGKYVYVNESFCKFLHMKQEDVVGLKDDALFGSQIAEEFLNMDKSVLKTQEEWFETKSIIFKDKRYYLEISKTPFLDGVGKFVGIITIVKDLTEITHERHLREKAMKNSMRSLMRIMQRHDEHLVKHAKFLKALVLRFSKKLNLSQEDITTLEVCANLSQIGKIYVPQEILNATSELNDQDLVVYHTHIEDTAFILDTVDWSGLPVVKTVYAMHEHLDGTGYPNALKAEEIGPLSRVLSVCDRFCELVSPRRGYKVYTPEEAVKWMVNERGCYDLALIQSLAEMITEDGSSILQEI